MKLTEMIFHPNKPCVWCGQEVGGEELVLLESGEVRPMVKDPDHLMFVPDWKKPKRNLNLCINAFHFQCFYTSMTELGMEWGDRTTDRYCSSCTHDFRTPFRHAHRCTIGEIGPGDVFEADIRIPRSFLMCTKCVCRVVGGGDEEAGDARIYAHLNT